MKRLFTDFDIKLPEHYFHRSHIVVQNLSLFRVSQTA
jgi:hypothetical protein